MLGLLMAIGVAVAPAAPPPNPCRPANSCRYVEVIDLKVPEGVSHYKVGRWLPYLDKGRLRLVMGETVLVRLQAGAGVRAALVSGGRASDLPRDARDRRSEWRVIENQAASAMQGQYSIVHDDDGSSATPPRKGAVRFTLTQAADADTVILKVDNGTDHTLRYDAVVDLANGESRSTPVCPAARGSVWESWSDPILAIDLGNFSLGDLGQPDEVSISDCA